MYVKKFNLLINYSTSCSTGMFKSILQLMCVHLYLPKKFCSLRSIPLSLYRLLDHWTRNTCNVCVYHAHISPLFHDFCASLYIFGNNVYIKYLARSYNTDDSIARRAISLFFFLASNCLHAIKCCAIFLSD